MLLYTKDLPSGGALSPEVTSFELRPLTFIELLHRKSTPEITKLRTYIKDLKTLVDMDKNIGSASIVDADYLIYLMSMVTINEKLTFNSAVVCPHCGNSVKVQYSTKDITPPTIDSVPMTVVLNGTIYRITVPTISQFLDFANYLPPYADDWDLNLIKLYSLLFDYDIKSPIGLITKAVDSAIYSEVTMLHAIQKVLFAGLNEVTTECPNCKGGIAIEPLSSVANLFRLVLRHNSIDPTKIQFRKIRETT